MIFRRIKEMLQGVLLLFRGKEEVDDGAGEGEG